jgi:rhamnogalacturonyl hydrolase YesR
MYSWVDINLRGENGLYWDHIDLNGRIDRTQWSYNQGSMIGASTLLYQATGDSAYLLRAKEIARAALDYFTPERLDQNDVAFNAIFFRNLLLLHQTESNPAYIDAMQEYADRLWEARRDPDTNLLTTSQPTTLLDQSGLIQIYAMLAGV